MYTIKKLVILTFITNVSIYFKDKISQLTFIRAIDILWSIGHDSKSKKDSNRLFYRYFKFLTLELISKVRLNRTLLKSLFIERDKPIFESIRNELDQDVRNFLVFDNINLIIRHLQGNPFLLFQFITAIRQQRSIRMFLWRFSAHLNAI